MQYTSSRRFWTPTQWAAAGYVLINVRERGGIIDPVYVKRRFHSPVITAHEWDTLRAEAKRQHLQHARNRAKEMDANRCANNRALVPYRAYAEQQREAQRRQFLAEGRIPLDKMTFFDLL